MPNSVNSYRHAIRVNYFNLVRRKALRVVLIHHKAVCFGVYSLCVQVRSCSNLLLVRGCPEFCVNGGMDFRTSAFSPQTGW